MQRRLGLRGLPEDPDDDEEAGEPHQGDHEKDVHSPSPAGAPPCDRSALPVDIVPVYANSPASPGATAVTDSADSVP